MQQPHLGIQSDEQGRTSIIDPSKHEDLPTLCQRLHARVNAFIAAEAPARGFLKATQEQTKLSLRVIEEALDRYRFVCSSPYSTHTFIEERVRAMLSSHTAWMKFRSPTTAGKIASSFSSCSSSRYTPSAYLPHTPPFSQFTSILIIRSPKSTTLFMTVYASIPWT